MPEGFKAGIAAAITKLSQLEGKALAQRKYSSAHALAFAIQEIAVLDESAQIRVRKYAPEKQ